MNTLAAILADPQCPRPNYVESHDGEQTLITRPKNPAHGRAVLMFSVRASEAFKVGQVMQWKGVDYVVERIAADPYDTADPLEAQPGQA